MAELVQANARVPEAARPILLSVAARLRDAPGFLDQLQAFLADEAGGSPWADRIVAIEGRLAALEETELTKRKPGQGQPRDPQTGAFGPSVDNVHDRPERPAGNSAADWPTRAAAITISTGEGRGRKLTADGAALFEEMVRAGVRNPEIARILGMARQSVDARARRIRPASS